eukprot:Gb_25533 [translate_table: standard]
MAVRSARHIPRRGQVKAAIALSIVHSMKSLLRLRSFHSSVASSSSSSSSSI